LEEEDEEIEEYQAISWVAVKNPSGKGVVWKKLD
jgi:hypothetical protein